MRQKLIRRDAAQFMQDYLQSIGETDLLFSYQEKVVTFAELLQHFKTKFAEDKRTIGSFSDHLLDSLTTDPDRFTILRNQLQIPTRTPLNQVVSLVEALIASDNPHSNSYYEQFFQWNLIQNVLREETRFKYQMEDRRLHHFNLYRSSNSNYGRSFI